MLEVAVAAQGTVWGTLSGYVPSCPMPSGDYYAFLLQVNLSPSRFNYQE